MADKYTVRVANDPIEQKELTVMIGPRGNRRQSIVRLNGIPHDEELTPKMARQALRIAGSRTGEVWEEDYSKGYRVYAKSARKMEGPHDRRN